MEIWRELVRFPRYSVSDAGRVRNDVTGRILRTNVNQQGVTFVGLMDDGVQYHRSVALLVATAFIPEERPEINDTPIQLDGDRSNNRADNLMWRPRWYAIMYNKQFKERYHHHIPYPIEDVKTGYVADNSFECAMHYGLLEKDIVMSVLNRTYAWPTYQQFRVVEH